MLDNATQERESLIITRAQTPRLQVKISKAVKNDIQPIFSNREGGELIVKVAEGLELLETLKLLYEEDARDEGTVSIHVSPSRKLLTLAQSFYLPPQLLVRAATCKIRLNVLAGIPLDTLYKVKPRPRTIYELRNSLLDTE